MESNASNMLEAALEQMDDIIAGKWSSSHYHLQQTAWCNCSPPQKQR